MAWMVRALAGPVLWATLFSGVYALHGLGCARGWQQQPVLWGDLHHMALWALWGAGLAGHVMLVRTMPCDQGIRRWLIVAGAWIGLVSSAFTLFPVTILSTCL
ncbi:hypothetical protein [Falsirhodobacter sp. alg1]|uniref:hypothetical protein n=1 Tax=Falsirhodobacter sp. alg1 TaxID=1472418 RepID=UPI000788AF69|nr:hypothetical protein [Falsirhodobacter sp. alg1]